MLSLTMPSSYRPNQMKNKPRRNLFVPCHSFRTIWLFLVPIILPWFITTTTLGVVAADSTSPSNPKLPTTIITNPSSVSRNNLNQLTNETASERIKPNDKSMTHTEEKLQDNNKTTTSSSSFNPTMVSLAESIEITKRLRKNPEVEQLRRQYWAETLEDIRKLGLEWAKASTTTTTQKGPGFFSQWKFVRDDPGTSRRASTTTTSTTAASSAFSENNETQGLSVSQESSLSSSTLTSQTDSAATTTATNATPSTSPSSWGFPKDPTLRLARRFEGFPTWDRLLQDWSEEIQLYLEEVDAQAQEGYSMSNYGRGSAMRDVISAENKTSTINDTAVTNVTATTPEPAVEEGEEEAFFKLESKKKTVSSTMPIPQPAQPGEEVLPHTDIADKSKRILIVTTASLPWRTGTAVNPLLRAAYLLDGRREAGGSVTLLLPWLERPEDQDRVYGANNGFATPEDQEEYIRTWLRDSANMPQASNELNIQWYTAWQNKVENSIYSMGDITAQLSSEEVDICILEEPEHLNWYRAPGESWTKKFKHVVGILHTNYFQYALDQPAALIRAPAMRLLCSWMCRAHCHRIIKLSATLDKVAPEKELVENVHGVRETFLNVGIELRDRLSQSISDPIFGRDADPTIYFIGKLLWSKGLGSLMELLKYAEESANLTCKVDMYGGGPDKEAADKKAQSLGLNMPFHGPLDHAELAWTHKIFVNPSTSEVLCTTTAEAISMGKFVIIPSHPSNDFFAQFPNCLTYATKEEFVGTLYYAMTHSPEPLSEEYAYALSWEAATERLIASACIPTTEAQKMEEFLSSGDASIEITLPPLVESDESRKGISTVLQYSRLRFRQFRSRLSREVRDNKVLPKPLKSRLVSELDKRLDLDLDELLSSPKLRLRLSPAELDKTLLELYDTISESPGGDILRVIGGAGSIGLQNFYMRRHAERKRWQEIREGIAPELFPSFTIDEEKNEDATRSATDLVRRVLERHLPTPGTTSALRQGSEPLDQRRSTPKMCSSRGSSNSGNLMAWNSLTSPKKALQPRLQRSRNVFSILI